MHALIWPPGCYGYQRCSYTETLHVPSGMPAGHDITVFDMVTF